jgi:dihydroorotase
MTYDLIVNGGLVLDPSQGLYEKKDLAIENGRISRIAASITEGSGKKVITAEGLIVTPGLIDLHSHVAKDVLRLSVDPDVSGLMKGCTTLVDAGSSGELLFNTFKKYVIERARSRVLAFLNIESLGMLEFVYRKPTYSDQEWAELLMRDNGSMEDLFVNTANTLEVIRNNPDSIVGIKWAHHGLGLLKIARKVADESNSRIMAENRYRPDFLKYLRKGDIITHIYIHQDYPNTGITDDFVAIFPEIFEAVKRGIILDVGHGEGSFSWKVAALALKEGLKPDVISTDLWIANVNGPVYDLPTTLSKFLHLGMSIEEVFAAATKRPAEVIGRQGEMGTLREGAVADVSLFSLEEGKFPLVDSNGETRVANNLLVPVHVVREGRMVK